MFTKRHYIVIAALLSEAYPSHRRFYNTRVEYLTRKRLIEDLALEFAAELFVPDNSNFDPYRFLDAVHDGLSELWDEFAERRALVDGEPN
jgi:hypothetical protein